MMGILLICLVGRLACVCSNGAQSTHVSIFGKSCSFCLFVSSGQACSKRGASVCSNGTVPACFNIWQIVLCFFPTLPHNQNSLFFAKSTKSTAKETTLQQRTMVCNNNNILDGDLSSANTRMRSSSVCSCRLNSCVSSREGEGHEKGRFDFVFLSFFDGLSTHLEDHRPSQEQLQVQQQDYQYHYRRVIHFIDLSTK
jgi:hypothetical protein